MRAHHFWIISRAMLQQACCLVRSFIGVGKVYLVHVHILSFCSCVAIDWNLSFWAIRNSLSSQARLHAGGLAPPVTAQKVSQSKVEWGGVRNDSYAWLQDKTISNPEVLSYLEQVQHTRCKSCTSLVVDTLLP